MTPISTDHSPVLFSLSKEKTTPWGKRFCKCNNSLTKDQNYIIEIKKLIRNFSNKNESLFNCQLKWDFLKFAIKCRKHVAKEKPQQRTNLENQLKKLKRNLDEDNLSKHNSIKNELYVIYDHIAENTQIRSKCDWYEHAEKYTFFCLI